ncbi:hypothetical protein DPMN_145551 [Dreissena polymorpha]|uniref:B box-type domain-containing protein n=2 Tax=Dreissena polymorpha TaxID=45954 RepID=A0A9D4F686_DREPO|nr:hypothetical protein DPMN_145551 [Dreissena polymorpha]
MEDLLLKCDVHNDKILEFFCQDHSQLCCTACVLLNHRQCTNMTLICESVKKMSLDMKHLSINLHSILGEINKFKSSQETSIQFVEASYNEKMQEIREQRKKLNAALDELENATLKELDEIRTTLQTSLKKDMANCNRLKDELKQLSEAVNVLCEKSKKEIEFIASRKSLDKIQESKTYLKENPVKLQSSIIYKANIDIERFLSQHESLGRIVDGMQSLTLKINPEQLLTVKRNSRYIVKMSSDTSQIFSIYGICCLPSGQVIVTDVKNKNVKLLDKHNNVCSHCECDYPSGICQITSSEVAVAVHSGVQFISVSNGKLVTGRKVQFPHAAYGIAFHQGALYVTSGTALYLYTLTGSLVKKLYEDTHGDLTVWQCAVSPSGDKIYVTNQDQHKLITLATDGTLISTFTDPELKDPRGIHVTPAGHVLVVGFDSHTVMQVDGEGRKKLGTLAKQKDGLQSPLSVCCNTNTHQIIVGQCNNNTICVMELQ